MEACLRAVQRGKLESMELDLDLLVTPGLGDNSYLLISGDEALVVDPQRDVGRYLERVHERRARIRRVLETHVHNDYVTGALELAKATGAEVVAPARGGYQFAHRPVAEGDRLSLGDLTISILETPGHTPEHVSYAVSGATDGTVEAVFTGGSLMVGGAGRTDLLGAERTDELTRAQYRSLHRLAALPPDARVLPTHGAGSFCGAGPAPKARTSTIGDELSGNGALRAPDEGTFVREQLSGLLAYPRYYANMAPINRAGPRPIAEIPEPRALDPGSFADGMEAGAWAVDARSRNDFAAAHIPGSLNVELDDTFGSYVGWLVPFNAALLLVLPQPELEALAEARAQLVRIGYERVEGYLAGGIVAWTNEGRATSSYPTASFEDLCRALGSGQRPWVLDVRQRSEWDAGHIEGSEHVFVGDLPQQLDAVPRDEEVWAVCATGHRSSMAASLLDRQGIPVRLVGAGGVPGVLRLCGPAARSETART
jgi:hydroxyacylglutathione hydrolase